MRRRALIVLLVAVAALGATASAADAHALVRSSDPANGAILSAPPSQVTVTFTEPPDPKLSFIHVLNEQGKAVESSAAHPVPGNGLQWVVPLPKDLPDGVYTVSWRSLSRTDGHVTAGSFSFGIGEAPTVTAGQQSVNSPTGTATGLVLNPNPTAFLFANTGLFSLSQTLSIQLNGGTGLGTATGQVQGTTTVTVPAPAGLVLALTGLPLLGAGSWLRRRLAQA